MISALIGEILASVPFRALYTYLGTEYGFKGLLLEPGVSLFQP